MEELRAAWRAAQRRHGLAESTIEARDGELRRYLEHVGDRWTAATWHDVDAWQDTCRHGARARYRATSNLAAFYKWARRTGLTDVDPTALVERPRLPGRAPRPVPPGSALAAHNVAGGDLRLMVALMVFGGLRCIEVSRLLWVDVDDVAGEMWVHGKGNRWRRLAIGPELEDDLAMAPRRGAHVVGPMTPVQVSHRVNRYLRIVGTGGTAHQLRHTFATAAYREARDIGVVQHLLGHASPATTAIYAQMDSGRADEVMRNLYK